MFDFEKIKNFIPFLNKEEELTYPYEFFIIKLNDVRKSKGGDKKEFNNKIIERYKNGELVEIKMYTKEYENALRKDMPGYEETPDDEDFEFYPFDELGYTKYKR